MHSETNILKNPYLTIPIETYKCEIYIRRFRKLNTLEKLTLKLIFIDNSLKNLINAFQISTHTMNYVIAQLFYHGFIQIDLNQSIVEISEKILPYVKENKLDEYLEQDTEYKKRKILIIQEKIGGEIISWNQIKKYISNPNPRETDYFDLRSSPPNTFPNIKDYSLSKYTKSSRNEIADELENIEKIDFIDQLPYQKLYIPLKQHEGKMILDIDFEIIPRHIQKIWINAYESEYEINEDFQDLEIEIPKYSYLSMEQLNNDIKKTCSHIETSLKSIQRKMKSNLNVRLLKNAEELYEFITYLEDSISYVDKVDLKILRVNEIPNFLENELAQVKNYAVLCVQQIDSFQLEIFQILIKKIISMKKKLIILWGNNENLKQIEIRSKIDNLKKTLIQNNTTKYDDHIHIFYSNAIIKNDFFIIDNSSTLYFDLSYLAHFSNLTNKEIPIFKFYGGLIPLHFLDLVIENIPRDLQVREILNRSNLSAKSSTSISENKSKLIEEIKIIWKNIEFNLKYKNYSKISDLLKKFLAKIKKILAYFNCSIFFDLEHDDILIDLLREDIHQITIFSNEIDEDIFGPHFSSNIKQKEKVDLILRQDLSFGTEEIWNRGILKLISFKDSNNNFNYLKCNSDLITSSMIFSDNCLVVSTYHFLTKSAKVKDRELFPKRIGIIITGEEIQNWRKKFLDYFKK